MDDSMTQQQTFSVGGMTCGHCVSAVSNELSTLPGVLAVAVDLAAGTATVDSTEPLDLAAVAAAIDEAGFELVP